MRICVISTTVYPLPLQGYGGLEDLVYHWACEFAKAGHQVSVVAPEGSQFPPELNIELVPTVLREPEESAYLKYRERLLKGDWDAIMDNSWLWFSVLAQQESERQLPVVHIYHSDANNLTVPPPIQYPCLVGLSQSHAGLIAKRWGFVVKSVYNGINLNLYKADLAVERNIRYLWLARWTPEKGGLEAIFLAKKCRIPIDMFGDTEIVQTPEYFRRCSNEADGQQVRIMGGISREECAKQYQTHRALIHWNNAFEEPFGLVPVEAMACGCPVITNGMGALKETVINGESGFIVNSLEEAEQLIKDDAISTLKTSDIIGQGTKFTIEKSAAGHLKCLEDVANKVYW